MSLKDQLTDDYKIAMKARETERVSVIRMVRAAIINAEKEKGDELTDEEVAVIIGSEARRRRESIAAYEESGHKELAAKERFELEMLLSYLPEQLSQDELTQAATTIIEQIGAVGIGDFGKVMGTLMSQVKGRADGNVVNETVRKLLGG